MRLLWRIFCLLASLASTLYLAGWLTNRYTPSSIDSGVRTARGEALAANLALLAVFALQHSGMARRFVKVRFGRPSYLLATALVLTLLFVKWEPMPERLWFAAGAVGAVLRGVQAAGLLLILWSVTVTRARAFFGFAPESGFQARGPYRWVRHPMMAGTLALLWAQPEMTEGRLLFNTFLTVYVWASRRWEERDLAALHGVAYTAYRDATPALFRFPTQ